MRPLWLVLILLLLLIRTAAGESASSYKEQHEAFVSNLKGTSLFCVATCLAHVPALLLLTKLLHIRCGLIEPRVKMPQISAVREYLFFVLPMLLVITVLADYNYLTLLVICSVVAALRSSLPQKVALEEFSVSSGPREAVAATDLSIKSQASFLSLFKGTNVVVTCLAILAVDFRIFPRRFAKTETFGLSLMDVGVGTFVVTTAITSKYARGLQYQPNSGSGGGGGGCGNSSVQNYLSRTRLAVLLLGVGRLVVIKLMHYQEHVSEYGVHWNFFVTLFFVWTAADVLHYFLQRRSSALCAAVGVLVVYQCLLLTPHFALTEYMFSPLNRERSLLDANKEGVISLSGYIPLYLIAEYLSYHLFFKQHHAEAALGETGNNDDLKTNGASSVLLYYLSESEPAKINLSTGQCTCPAINDQKSKSLSSHQLIAVSWNSQLVRRLSIVAALFWLLWALSSSMIQSTSRRLCNLTFVLFILALSLSLILLMYAADALGGGRAVPIGTVDLTNKHSLAVFLVANVLTGLANSSMQTIYASRAAALTTLTLYSAAVTLVPWLIEIATTQRSEK